MPDLFSYPFQVNPDGTVMKTPDGEDYYAQELANLIQTTPGERPLVPDYGIQDPVFDELNTVELLGKIEMFGPPVVIPDEGVKTSFPSEGVLDIEIQYTPHDTEDEDEYGFDDEDEDNYYDDEQIEDVDYYGFNNATD